MPALVINGTIVQYAENVFPHTGTELIERLKLDAHCVVMEVEHETIPRAAFPTFPINPGQTIDLVCFIAGG